MAPRTKQPAGVAQCQVCGEHATKYRCPTCPVRYCSVPCYKIHKESCGTANAEAGPSSPRPKPPLTVNEDLGSRHTPLSPVEGDSSTLKKDASAHIDLRPLTSLLWPPEPDPSIFTDPLKKEDPKPLKHEQLLRIATSPDLRHLLKSTNLPSILRILDGLPSPNARSTTLSRLLGLDSETLSKPHSNSLVSQRDSPPPLGDLLDALAGKKEEERRMWNEEGWWLGREGSNGGRIWIGEEERKVMRLFAAVVCKAIDGGEDDDVAWGSGELSWEI